MKTSFIVLTYNRSDALLAVLQSLADQCGPGDEVIVADDGSRPEQVALMRANCPVFRCEVRHVWHPDMGFTASRARNLGALHATGDYLVFIDGDCVPNRRFVHWHARLAEPGCFVNGSRVLLSRELTERILSQDLDVAQCPTGFWIGARLRGDSNKVLHLLAWPWRSFRVKHGFQWRGIRSCNMAIWRSDFLSVDGFDETFEGWGHEDADLVLRLAHLGVRRKNGFMATEVFHLWHRENKRDHESANKARVVERMKQGIVKAEKGLSALDLGADVKINRLNGPNPL